MIKHYIAAVSAMKIVSVEGRINITLKNAPIKMMFEYGDNKTALEKGLEEAKRKWPEASGWTGHACTALESSLVDQVKQVVST